MYELVEILAHTVAHLEEAAQDNSVSKEDLAADMRNRLCIITGKILSYPVTTNFALPYRPRGLYNEEAQTAMDNFFSEN